VEVYLLRLSFGHLFVSRLVALFGKFGFYDLTLNIWLTIIQTYIFSLNIFIKYIK